jgi:hypothetical protein
MAINLTDEIFGDADRCLSFDNVIPGTVTGNSDTADYKDTVFATFPPVTNCGILKIRKVTKDPDGNVFSDPSNPAFGYTVTKSGDALRFAADAANYPVDGAAPQISIVRPNTNTPAGPALLAGEANTHTHNDLRIGSNYTLVEATPPPTPYVLVSVICTDATGQRDITPDTGDFTTYSVSVPSGTFEYTLCVITNQFVKTTPTVATAQSARVFLFDSVNITALTPGASNRPTSATFRLYSDAGCEVLMGSATGALTPTARRPQRRCSVAPVSR